MYNEFIKSLKDVCIKRKLKLKNIGSIQDYPIYQIIINNFSPINTICFSAGIHGDEIAGPLSILKFLKEYNLNKIKGNRLIIFPVANPFGFDKQKRRNCLNKDLNRHFCDRNLNNENKILYNSIKNKNINFFHALHEDVDETKFYLYAFERKQEKIYREILKLAKLYVPINTAYGSNGLIINQKDGSFEDRLFRDGIPFSMCTEIPGKYSLKKKINLNIKLMNLVIDFVNNKTL